MSKKRAEITVRLLFVLFVLMVIMQLRPYSVHAAGTKYYSLVCGETKQLRKNNAVWSSRKNSVATVSQAGLVTAVAKGKTTITAKVGKKKYRYKITVESPYFNKTAVKVKLNKTKTLKVKGTTKKFKIVSSDPSVVKVKKKAKNKVKITALKDGNVVISAVYKNFSISCQVTAGKGAEPDPQAGTFSLYYKGTAIQTLTYNKSDVARYVSSISGYGQSAPLYTSVNGGDGLESIFAETNNGNVNVPGVQLSEEARLGTVTKACLWARAVCDSEFHGYDDGQRRERDCWGIAKESSPGTGDYCCFSLAECAYYFAGVNLLGECLGNPEAATYPPYSDLLFEHGGVSFWGDTEPRPVTPRGAEFIFPKSGFVKMKKQKSDFVYQPGDIAVSFFGGQQHEELVIQAGTAKTCQVAEAYGPGGGGRAGGDQSGVELTVKNGFYKASSIKYVFRFTGAGVVLNTVGLAG